MTKPKFQLECLEGRLTPTVSFFLVPPESPSGAYSIGSYDPDQPDASQTTVAILGLADGDIPVSLVGGDDGTASFILAASSTGFEATLYTLNTSTAGATVVGSTASISLVLADGSAVAFPSTQDLYSAGLDDAGHVVVSISGDTFATVFRVDPSTGLAMDGDTEADGTQPDGVYQVNIETCEPFPEELLPPPEICLPLPALGGIDASETLVSVVTAGETTYAFAVNADADTGTLYQVSTVDGETVAEPIGEIGSIALVLSDGSAVDFSANASDYSIEWNAESGVLVVRSLSGMFQTAFRVDPSMGLAMDGDAEADGTQPDGVYQVNIETCEPFPEELLPPPEICLPLPALGGIDASETLVSVVTAGETTYALAVNADTDTGTLYMVSLVDGDYAGTAIGEVGSVALTFADGRPVDFTGNPSDYSVDVDADGNLVVYASLGGMQTSFRVDPSTGSAIDGDADADGTQPDSLVAICYPMLPELVDDGEYPPEWAYRNTVDDSKQTLIRITSTPAGPLGLSLNFLALCDDGSTDPVLDFTTQPVAPVPALTYSTSGGKVTIVTANGRTGSFTPFVGYDGSVRTATGDINHDGIMDVVVVPSAVGAPGHIRVLSGADGSSLASFISFPGYLGSVDVAVADINGDGFDDIIASSTGGASGTVAIFNGQNFSTMTMFYPYGAEYAGTVRVSGYDPDGDGIDAILTSTGEGTRGHVKAFDSNLDVLLSFFSGAEGDLSGCYVVGGDLDGDGEDDIATGSGAGVQAEVHIFDGSTGLRRHSMDVFSGFMGGVRLAMVSSLTDPSAMDLVVGSGEGARATINVFDGRQLEVTDAYFAQEDAEASTEGVEF